MSPDQSSWSDKSSTRCLNEHQEVCLGEAGEVRSADGNFLWFNPRLSLGQALAKLPLTNEPQICVLNISVSLNIHIQCVTLSTFRSCLSLNAKPNGLLLFPLFHWYFPHYSIVLYTIEHFGFDVFFPPMLWVISKENVSENYTFPVIVVIALFLDFPTNFASFIICLRKHTLFLFAFSWIRCGFNAQRKRKPCRMN